MLDPTPQEGLRGHADLFAQQSRLSGLWSHSLWCFAMMFSSNRYLMSLMQVGKAEAITVDAVAYAAGMEVNDSDHKPVWARLLVNLPVTMQDKKRRKCSHLLKDCFLHSVPEPPQVLITPDLITLHPVSTLSVLHLQLCLSERHHCCPRQHMEAVPHHCDNASLDTPAKSTRTLGPTPSGRHGASWW